MSQLLKHEYYTIETTMHERPLHREWKAVKESRRNSTYGFHFVMGLVFWTKEACEKEIEKRKTKVV